MTWRAQIPFFCRIFLLNLPFVRTLLDNTCIHEIYADILYTYVNKLYKMIHICHSASAVLKLQPDNSNPTNPIIEYGMRNIYELNFT